jgi:peptide/nickel transport system permease protein
LALLSFILRRLSFLALVLLAVSFLVYGSILLLPGDPVTAILGAEGYDPVIAAQLRQQLGLGEPLPVAFGRWLERALMGDLGTSVVLSTRTSVSTLLLQRLAVTFELSVLAMTMALTIGILLGIVAALRRNTRVDVCVSIFSLTTYSMPAFFRGILLILFFSIFINIFPSGGYIGFLVDPLRNLKLMVLPSLSLTLGLMGVITRFTRSSMVEAMQKEFITTATAKGLPERTIIFKHALRNALIPVVTISGLEFGALMGGVVITETVFGLPGIGSLLVQGILERDYPVVQGATLFVTVAFVLANTAVDLLYTLIDPRVKLGER